MKTRPIIGITMGDPCGIGPEIVLRALAEGAVYETCRPLVLGDEAVMKSTKVWFKSNLEIFCLDRPESGAYRVGRVDMIGLTELKVEQLEFGRPTRETGRAMVDYINYGIDRAMDGSVQGLVTCPINKLAMHMAGIDFDGHTEILAHRTHTRAYVMMLAGSRLRVALVTIHIPLADVPGKLTIEGILATVRITAHALRNDFGIREPKLAVAGLNPHAGEQGLFGDEEIRTISPAIKRAKHEGINAAGPFPPDTVFHFAAKGRWDAVVCMYHDQGLIPFKMAHFSDGVNVTLGLPIVRTSVDHGTAYDIAGKGQADPESLISAIQMAAHHARQRKKG